MPNNKPDLDLIALAGLTKAGLRGIDSSSVGGNAHADKINLREMAGLDKRREMQQRRPNLLRGMDFLEEPKSRPLGQVDFDGTPLPDMPPERPVEFMPIPADLQQHVMGQLEHLDDDPRQTRVNEEIPTQQPSETIPQPTPDMDFDLFQFTMLKDMVKNLDVSISSMEDAINNLKAKRDMLMNLIKGKTDDGDKPE